MHSRMKSSLFWGTTVYVTKLWITNMRMLSLKLFLQNIRPMTASNGSWKWYFWAEVIKAKFPSLLYHTFSLLNYFTLSRKSGLKSFTAYIGTRWYWSNVAIMQEHNPFSLLFHPRKGWWYLMDPYYNSQANMCLILHRHIVLFWWVFLRNQTGFCIKTLQSWK